MQSAGKRQSMGALEEGCISDGVGSRSVCRFCFLVGVRACLGDSTTGAGGGAVLPGGRA